MAIHNGDSDEEIPAELVLDEGWWASVLAEESKFSQPMFVDDDSLNIIQNKGINWDVAQKIYSEDSIVELYVTGYNRGGLLVEDNRIQGFVPVSHLIDLPSDADDEERKEVLSEYVGRKIPLKIIECDPEQERVVFSERAALAGEGRRKQLFKILHPGDLVHGTVTNITDFGVFVDLGGQEGLIHVSELSWGRVQHPGDVLYIGQEIDAQVLQISEENARIALSYKRLTPNPWEIIEDIYKPGDLVEGKITAVTRFGAFTRLESGVEGLIHISTMKFPEGVKDPTEFLSIGKNVRVKIIHIDASRRRIGLCLEDPG